MNWFKSSDGSADFNLCKKTKPGVLLALPNTEERVLCGI